MFIVHDRLETIAIILNFVKKNVNLKLFVFIKILLKIPLFSTLFMKNLSGNTLISYI